MHFVITDILFIFLLILIYISIIFGIAWRCSRLDIVDIAWGGGFIVTAIASLIIGPHGALQYFTTFLVIAWGIRLGFYIFNRVRSSQREDLRYTEMRKTWKGNVAINAYMRVFLVQGILSIVVSVVVIFINLSHNTHIGWQTAAGALVWLVGFLFESIGDSQLRKHLADSTKKRALMTAGLWRYTRHPNYFGEAMQWWGIYVIALSVSLGWLTIISPLLITFLLLFVSGVPLTEKRFEGRPGWAEYKRQTSVFVPLPPKV